MQSAKERLDEVLEETKHSYNSFAKAIGLKRSQSLYDIRDGKIKSISLQLATLIVDNFYKYNIEWLRTGEGDKFIAKKTPRLEARPLYLASDPNDYDNDGAKFEHQDSGIIRMRIKVVPHKAYGSYFRGYQDPEFYEDLETISIDVHKEHQGNYLAFEVGGDSMIPTDPALFEHMALPGWKAISRELPRHHWKYKLHTHHYDTWVIVHNTEGVLIKSIVAQDVDKGTITIHSLNPNYEDEILHLDDIAQIFSVVKYMIDKR